MSCFLGFRGLSPILLGSCSIIISWFRLGFPGLCPYSSGTLFHHHVLLRLGFRGLSPILLASCSIIISWFRLGFLGLSPYSCGTLFYHPFLVPARVPGLVAQKSLELNGVLNPSRKQVCSTLIFWFWVFGHSVPSSFLQFFCFRVGFRGLSP